MVEWARFYYGKKKKKKIKRTGVYVWLRALGTFVAKPENLSLKSRTIQ